MPSWLSRPPEPAPLDEVDGDEALSRTPRRAWGRPHHDGRSTPKPATSRAGAASARKLWAPLEVQRETGRRGLAQRFSQRGVDAHRPAQLGQEDLMRGAERTAGPLQLVARPPDLFGTRRPG